MNVIELFMCLKEIKRDFLTNVQKAKSLTVHQSVTSPQTVLSRVKVVSDDCSEGLKCSDSVIQVSLVC